MRKILTSIGTLAAAGLLTVGLTTPASAATGTLYITQNGQTTAHTNPTGRTCYASDSTKGDVTFSNRTDQPSYVTDNKCRNLIAGDHFLRSGQTRTLPAGTAVVWPS
ncbi:hypothetical protein ACIQ7Q_11465 [Streptomyces sp. NPDC096176]|uniref:hypothetical protein n=1 Tax=Streptomyces sp. NPDC096176 TaxID=3366079 RepID=UPI0037F74C9C